MSGKIAIAFLCTLGCVSAASIDTERLQKRFMFDSLPLPLPGLALPSLPGLSGGSPAPQPSAAGKKPAATGKQPAAGGKKPAAGKAKPPAPPANGGGGGGMFGGLLGGGGGGGLPGLGGGLPGLPGLGGGLPGLGGGLPGLGGGLPGLGGGLPGLGTGLPMLPGLDPSKLLDPTKILDPAQAMDMLGKATDILPGPLKGMLPGPLNPDTIKGAANLMKYVDPDLVKKILNPVGMAQLISSGALDVNTAKDLLGVVTSGGDPMTLIQLGMNNDFIYENIGLPLIQAGGFAVGSALSDGTAWSMISSGLGGLFG